MSYRILVPPEAGSLLRTFAPHVVLRLGRALAELAESIAVGENPERSELRIEDCVMRFVVDHAERLLRVVDVEQRESMTPLYAAAEAMA